MSSAAASAEGETLFCQRNNRLWVAVLVCSAAFVLGLALWLAFEDGEYKGWSHKSSSSATNTAVAPSPVRRMPAAAITGGGQRVAPAPAPGAIQAARLPPAPVIQVATPVGAGTAQRLQASFNQVADSIRPCVVNINAVRRAQNHVAQINNDPRFIDPFDGVPDKVIGKLAFESVGSGVIVDERGYVITNDHVVSGAVAIMVTRFNEQTPLPATLVATDRNRDLALLKLDGPGPFPAAKLANSSKVEVGDWVLAVGNPFGLGHTVTAGIISSRRSSLRIGGVSYKDLLQTDAPINQGSSGGPLVNLQSKIVGINTAIYAPTGVFNGTGFAIPSNQVGAFVASAMTDAPTGSVAGAGAGAAQQNQTKAWLGIQGTNVSASVAAKLGMADAQGVFINSIDQDSPAEDAELRRGDVITAMAGQSVQDKLALAVIVGALPPGLKVPVVTWRNGRAFTQKVKLGFKPGAAAMQPRTR